MKIKNLQQIEAFRAALDRCQGDVYLKSIYGDQYNLKSTLSQYVAMADLLRDSNEELELFAQLAEDEAILMEFLATLEN